MSGFRGSDQEGRRSFQNFEEWQRKWDLFISYIFQREAQAQRQINAEAPIQLEDLEGTFWDSNVGEYEITVDADGNPISARKIR